MKTNLIYSLYCPIHHKPVYVGQSSVGMNRPFTHIKEKSHNAKVNDWVRYLKDQSLEPVLVILEHDFEDKYLNDKEKFWLNKTLNDGHLLLNQVGVSPAFYQATEFDVEPSTDFLADIRLYVKGRRKFLKLTQPELAARAGVGLRFVRELETGSKSNFQTVSIEKLLNLLGNVRIKLEPITNIS
jgi:hypothetical protein